LIIKEILSSRSWTLNPKNFFSEYLWYKVVENVIGQYGKDFKNEGAIIDTGKAYFNICKPKSEILANGYGLTL
jgi:hypothetical protein